MHSLWNAKPSIRYRLLPLKLEKLILCYTLQTVTITLHIFSFSRNSFIEELTSGEGDADCFAFDSIGTALDTCSQTSGIFNHHFSSSRFPSDSILLDILGFSFILIEFSPTLRLMEVPRVSSSLEIGCRRKTGHIAIRFFYRKCIPWNIPGFRSKYIWSGVQNSLINYRECARCRMRLRNRIRLIKVSNNIYVRTYILDTRGLLEGWRHSVLSLIILLTDTSQVINHFLRKRLTLVVLSVCLFVCWLVLIRSMVVSQRPHPFSNVQRFFEPPREANCMHTYIIWRNKK